MVFAEVRGVFWRLHEHRCTGKERRFFQEMYQYSYTVTHIYLAPPARSAVEVIFDGRFKGCMIQVMAKWWTYHVDRLVVACLTSRVIS